MPDSRILSFVEAHELPEAAIEPLEELVRSFTTAPSAAPLDVPGADGSPGATFADWLADGTDDQARTHAQLFAGRYTDLGLIAAGGMGQVRRVRDNHLGRTLAMKLLHPHLLARSFAVARFVEEAQATAQLQHPCIVPVHDAGQLPDGRVWFTMREVQGRTLAEVIRSVHGESRWTLRRLIGAFVQVCHAIAYAHQRGVLHRDLKPQNIMVGVHGEVLVLDWGLAKVAGRSQLDPPDDPDAGEAEGAMVTTDRQREGLHRTQLHTVAGTAAYMSPEQARGEVDQLGPATDVYALGAVLYQVLTGRAPYDGASRDDILEQVRSGPPTHLTSEDERTPAPPDAPEIAIPIDAPPELVVICERAMAREPEGRHASAAELAEDIEGWLDGSRRRSEALEVVQRALALEPEARTLLARAQEARDDGLQRLEALDSWQGEAHKADAWATLDGAAELARRAGLLDLQLEQGLQAALRIDPALPEAHEALLQRYLERHRAAESARDPDETSRAEALVHQHLDALPPSSPRRQPSVAYLTGDGALTVVTDPPGAEVLLQRYGVHNRRLVAEPARSLGHTPLHEVSLPGGSYRCLLRCEGHSDVRYPVVIGRGEHWHGVAPNEDEPRATWLPPDGVLGDDEVYVPAGWFQVGGDRHSVHSLPSRRLWCPGFVIQRFAVTNRQYIEFLDDLVSQGREDLALRSAPHERGRADEARGAMLYNRDSGGRFELQVDADGDAWLADWPVCMVDWHGARAYLQWQADQTDRPWRFPSELEWEKAARGVDGRFHPWGDFGDPSWCCMRDSHDGPRQPSVVRSFEVDTSPYGVRGLAGNMEDWCAGAYRDAGPVVRSETVQPPVIDPDDRSLRVVRGGSWFGPPGSTRSANRHGLSPWTCGSYVGFRGVWPVAPDPAHEGTAK